VTPPHTPPPRRGHSHAHAEGGPRWGQAASVRQQVRSLLEDPDTVIQGDRVLHLRYRVRN
jgi:hypothetical protein